MPVAVSLSRLTSHWDSFVVGLTALEFESIFVVWHTNRLCCAPLRASVENSSRMLVASLTMFVTGLLGFDIAPPFAAKEAMNSSSVYNR